MLVQVVDQVWAQVRAQVWAQVRDQVGDQVWDQVGAQVRDQVRAQVRDQVNRCGYGSHDSSWIHFYQFFRQECSISACDKILGIESLLGCGWWWPFENLVLMTERPLFIHRDAEHRLHSEDRMAIEYPDGWGIYAWHGLRLPATHEYIVREPEGLNVGVILGEQNAELRRVMMEKYTTGRFLKEAKAKVLDTSIQRMPQGSQECVNELLAIDLPGDPDGRLVAVRVVDPSTMREYFLRVPPNVSRVQEALAWTFDVGEKEYAGLIQET